MSDAPPATVSIGEFSRLTHLSVKALRHYHDIGLLAPAEIDSSSGYRRYGATQADDALLIGRLRALDMPLTDVQTVLAADDADRNRAISAHLSRMESDLARTRAIVSSLRTMLDGSAGPVVEYREAPGGSAISFSSELDKEDVGQFCADWFPQLYTATAAAGGVPNGPGGGLYSTDWFAENTGSATLFVPLAAPFDPPAPFALIELSTKPLAVATHRGPFEDLDRTYTRLGQEVIDRGLSADAPIRENYLVTPDDTTDDDQLVTEVCWPITALPAN